MGFRYNDVKKESAALDFWRKYIRRRRRPTTTNKSTASSLRPNTMRPLPVEALATQKRFSNPHASLPEVEEKKPVVEEPAPVAVVEEKKPAKTPVAVAAVEEKKPAKPPVAVAAVEEKKPTNKRQQSSHAPGRRIGEAELVTSEVKKVKVDSAITDGILDNHKMDIIRKMLSGVPIDDSSDNISTINKSQMCFEYFKNIMKRGGPSSASAAAAAENDEDAEVVIEDEDDYDYDGSFDNMNDEIMQNLILQCEIDRNNAESSMTDHHSHHQPEEKPPSATEKIMTMNSFEICSYEHEQEQMHDAWAGEEPCVNGDNCVVKAKFGFIMKAAVFPSQLQEINKNKTNIRNEYEANPCVCCGREAIAYQTLYVAIANNKDKTRIVTQRYQNALGVPGEYNYHAAIIPTGDVYGCVKNNWSRMSVKIYNGRKYLVQDEDYYRVPLNKKEAEQTHDAFATNPAMLQAMGNVPLVTLKESAKPQQQQQQQKNGTNFLKGVPQKRK